MTDLVTYLWASYGVDGLRYCCEVGPNQGINGGTAGFVSMDHPDGANGFAVNLLILSREYERPLELIWEVPPDKKDIVSVMSSTRSFEAHRELTPKEKERIIKDLQKVLGGKLGE